MFLGTTAVPFCFFPTAPVATWAVVSMSLSAFSTQPLELKGEASPSYPLDHAWRTSVPPRSLNATVPEGPATTLPTSTVFG